MNFQLPLLYEGFDRQRARTHIVEAEESPVGYTLGEDQYFLGSWTPVDNRPTKEEALERIEDFNILVDIVDYLVPEEVSNNIPYWIRGPFGIAPKAAELLIELDPLDRIQD